MLHYSEGNYTAGYQGYKASGERLLAAQTRFAGWQSMTIRYSANAPSRSVCMSAWASNNLAVRVMLRGRLGL